MKLFSSVSGKQVDQFAEELADELAKRLPLSMAQGLGQKISEKRINKITEGIFQKAAKFRESNHIGWYKKARLGNSFKWKLKDYGYNDEFIDAATEELIIYLSGKVPEDQEPA